MKKLLEQSKKEKEKLLIGAGNYESNILIVGHEPSIDPNDKEQIVREIDDNIFHWERDIEKQLSEIADWVFDINYSPLYPYKGSQINSPKPNNGGTSQTWYNYQKLMDAIINKGSKSKKINFFESCFITELNQITSRSSKKLKDKDLQEKIEKMIEKRVEFIFSSDYIRSFPVIIMACSNYVIEHKIDIRILFDVEKEGEIVRLSKYNSYSVYKNGKGKIIILTRQFSNGISNKLIEEIGKDIAGFCKEHNISL